MRLITIPISHYVEKAKWALDRSGLSYREEGHVPGLHAMATLWHTRGKHRATPVLIDSETVVADSTNILRYLTTKYAQRWIYPSDAAFNLEERFDRNLGPHTRRLIYHYLFATKTSPATLFSHSVVPVWQRALLPFAGDALRQMMIQDMKIEAVAAGRSRQTIDQEFAFVGDLLADSRPYLSGDKLSAADIAFAALAAPVLLPKEYGAKLPQSEDFPVGSEIRRLIEHYRQTVAGQFVLRLYQKDRR